MSAVGAVNAALSASAAVTALVPAARIQSGVVPITSTSALPTICIQQVSGTERLPVAKPTSYVKTERVQVTVYAADYDSKKTILDAVRNALAYARGTLGGVAVDSITPDGEGPDLDDPGISRYERSRDFIVVWHSAAA